MNKLTQQPTWGFFCLRRGLGGWQHPTFTKSATDITKTVSWTAQTNWLNLVCQLMHLKPYGLMHPRAQRGSSDWVSTWSPGKGADVVRVGNKHHSKNAVRWCHLAICNTNKLPELLNHLSIREETIRVQWWHGRFVHKINSKGAQKLVHFKKWPRCQCYIFV